MSKCRLPGVKTRADSEEYKPGTAIKAYRCQWDPQTSSGRALSVENNIEPPWAMPPGSSELNVPTYSASPDERVALEALAMMAEVQATNTSHPPADQCASDAVQSALAEVYKLNEGPLTPATSTEQSAWKRAASRWWCWGCSFAAVGQAAIIKTAMAGPTGAWWHNEPQMAKTNLPVEEMLPDRDTRGHDPRYWCLPPMREDPDAVVPITGGYKFHLVTRGRQVGVWKTGRLPSPWCRAIRTPPTKAITRMSLAWGNGRRTANWVFTHTPSSRRTPRRGNSGRARERVGSRGALPPPPASHRTSGAVSGGRSRPASVHHYAIWGAGVVYSTKYTAKLAFQDAVEEGREPELLSTDEFEVALAYAEGDC
ncbi:hypothetical protein B0H14DRAFT_2617077 [Mycena olivaceomarginata]|nr:hypothetical protein B0H14DRAFT_2617077 [Mycena olivaceomarginata]